MVLTFKLAVKPWRAAGWGWSVRSKGYGHRLHVFTLELNFLCFLISLLPMLMLIVMLFV